MKCASAFRVIAQFKQPVVRHILISPFVKQDHMPPVRCILGCLVGTHKNISRKKHFLLNFVGEIAVVAALCSKRQLQCKIDEPRAVGSVTQMLAAMICGDVRFRPVPSSRNNVLAMHARAFRYIFLCRNRRRRRSWRLGRRLGGHFAAFRPAPRIGARLSEDSRALAFNFACVAKI